jgi:pilus assembly protein Flp/PilA
MKMLRHIANFIKREHGFTATQYAIVAALVMAVLIVAVTLMGQSASRTFQATISSNGSAPSKKGGD